MVKDFSFVFYIVAFVENINKDHGEEYKCWASKTKKSMTVMQPAKIT